MNAPSTKVLVASLLRAMGAQAPVEAHRVAQSPRERADPLTNGHLGQDLVAQVRREVAHAPPEARRAESSPFTRERDEHRLAARAAREPHQTALEPSTLEVLVEVTLDELGQPSALGGASTERRPVLADDLVEQRVFGKAPIELHTEVARRERR